MTKLDEMANNQIMHDGSPGFLLSWLRASFVIRHLGFVIACASIFMLMTKTANADSQNLIGKWNVEITFANEEHRSLRFEARSDGKGTLALADPHSVAWGAAQPSEAMWSRSEGN